MTWKRGKNADIFVGSQPWTEEQEALISEKIEHFYERFLRAVAKGRKMSRDEVHEVAQGRVWLGTDAKEKGLVDHLGGLDAAINRAVELAGIHRNYDVLEYPEVTWQSALRSAASPSLIEASEDVSTLEVWMEILGKPFAPLLELAGFSRGEPLAMLPFSIQMEGE